MLMRQGWPNRPENERPKIVGAQAGAAAESSAVLQLALLRRQSAG
jgi:hypothetical protein